MKILIVGSGNSGFISPFIKDQVKSLNDLGVNTDFYLIRGKGILGYLKNLPSLKRKIKSFQPDIVHAHYGLSGFLSVLQNDKPVIVTFHGSDINNKKQRFFSWVVSKLSNENIFVHKSQPIKIYYKKPINLIPCGVSLETFYPFDRSIARRKMGLNDNKFYILFSSRFDNFVKNYSLAEEAIRKLNFANLEIIELKNYTREEVNLLLNAVNVALLTSFSEGSPQFIKEAMACNIPIVSTDVGDVREVIGDTEGCYITSFDPKDVAKKIQKALEFGERTKGRERIIELGLDSETVAKKIIELYKEVLKSQR